IAPFSSRPEMVLALDDFVVFIANWSRKSENLLAIAKQLNIGLDSLLFVDDNPFERGHVREALPEVDVIELPRTRRSTPRRSMRADILKQSLCPKRTRRGHSSTRITQSVR
ncbi:hypothetical protein OAY01_05940, partial [Luminiphilus sp.]|nr:hypothetical protein [Luminiphilus sp.]